MTPQRTSRTSADRKRALRLAGALIGLAVALGACKHTGDEVTTTASVPDDYRLRHPIAIQEADRSIVVFVGRGRGGISAPQRADVMGMAQTWLQEGTGGISIDMPVNTPNARAAQESLREIQATLAAAGVPPRAVTVRQYRPEDPRHMAAIRLNYPKISAIAGPCGLWPEDLGPSINNKGYFENKPYYNFGCANQRNLAAMVDNPSDLVQPRTETPAYTARRNACLREISQGHLDRDHLSRGRQGQTQRHRQMISYARQNPEQQPDGSPPSTEEHIAPAPRVSVQAFCETVETAAAVQSAGEDRRLGKAHLKIQMGGMAAAIEAYRSAPTPNVIILETEGRNDILLGLDQLATVCDAGTRVIVIGRINDVTLYRELVRRGVSDYVIAPVSAIDVVRSVCNLFSAPEAKAVGRIIAVVGAKGGVGCLHRRPQRRLGDRARSGAGFGGRRPRPRLRHRRPRLQPGSAAGHRGRGILAGPGRYRLHRPPAVEMHRPSQPAGRAGDARPGLRFRRRRLRFDLRYASHHDALHRARRSASMVGMDQARADRRRRHPDRRGPRSRQSAQHQEHLRPPEGVAAERPRAALLPQPGRHPEAPGDPGQRIRQGDRKPADRDRYRSSRRCSARPPTTAR